MRGPLRKVVKVEEERKLPKATDFTKPPVKLTLECGHFKVIDACEMPKGNQVRCKKCLLTPLDLEARLKTLPLPATTLYKNL